MESRRRMNPQMQCDRNGKKTIQLPELSPGPAGPETHVTYQNKGEALGEHTTMRRGFLFSKTLFKYIFISTSVDTDTFHPLSQHFTDIILEALGLFDWCSHVLCPVSSCQLASWMAVSPWVMTQRPDHLKKQTKIIYLYTLMLTLRVRVVFSCLSEEDVSALQHGTVIIVINTGFMIDNVRRIWGYVKTLLPPERLSSQNACVFTHHCEGFTLSLSIY